MNCIRIDQNGNAVRRYAACNGVAANAIVLALLIASLLTVTTAILVADIVIVDATLACVPLIVTNARSTITWRISVTL